MRNFFATEENYRYQNLMRDESGIDKKTIVCLRLNFRRVVSAKHGALMSVYINFLESGDICN